ncbi:MAG: DUF4395 family protein [Desulfobacterales bacterium]
MIRGFFKEQNTVFTVCSAKLLAAFKVAPKMTNAGPKLFAARVGFVFCFLIALLYFTGVTELSRVVAAMLIFFALLEAAFGFCVACRMYPLYARALK